MNKAQVILAGMALMATAAAHADFSVTPAITTDYDWRGTSQSATDPAMQVGIDWSHDIGLHWGLWASTVDFGTNADLEVDLLADYSFGDEDAVAFNTGVALYTYPGSSTLNFPEIWFKASKGWFSGALWHSFDYFNSGYNGWYLDLNGTWAIGNSGFDVSAHVGHNFGSYFNRDPFNVGAKKYTDYSVGVTKSFGNFNASLKFVGSGQLETRTDVNNTEDRLILSVSTTLPWGN